MNRGASIPLIVSLALSSGACNGDSGDSTGDGSGSAESTADGSGTADSTTSGPSTSQSGTETSTTTGGTTTTNGTQTDPSTTDGTTGGGKMDCTPDPECMGGSGVGGVMCGDTCCGRFEWCNEDATPPTCMCADGPGCTNQQTCCAEGPVPRPDACGFECADACIGG